MHQTLLMIPHAWFEGRLLIAWLVFSVVVFAWLLYRHGPTSEAWSFLPVVAIVAAAIYFILPELEIYGINENDPAGPFVKVGLAIRGYGVCLVLAIASAISIIVARCRQAGINSDQILSLAFWMILSGIAGARILYVVQKSDQFFRPGASFRENLVGVLDMTEGGLVVYGSLVGGVIAAVLFLRFNKLPLLKTADLIAPGMMLGLAIGRIGCLMNGCCYGGICETPSLPSLQFPAGSPPYMQQIAYGDLIGASTAEVKGQAARTVTYVEPGSIADGLGIQANDQISIYAPDSERVRFFKNRRDSWDSSQVLVFQIECDRLGEMAVSLDELAVLSRPVHPTQIYSSINAVLLSLVLWFYWTIRRNDGEVFALMLILYSIARFLLEIIRRDESGLFGTDVTISQWVSIVTILAGFALMSLARLQTQQIAKSF